MKNLTKILILIGIMALVLGCGDNTDDSGSGSGSGSHTSVDKSFYGNWISIEGGDGLKIDKSFSNGVKSLGNNYIEVTKDGDKILYLRDGSNNITVTGQLYNNVKHIQKLDKESQEKRLVYKPEFKNSLKETRYKVTINDGFSKQTKEVSANGKFSFSGVHKGVSIVDIQQVIDIQPVIDDDNETETNVTITVRGEGNVSIGNFPTPTKEDKYNFKTKQVINTQDKDDRYMYENRTYTGKLVFENTGRELAVGLNYEIVTDDPYVEELTHEVVLGSVEAKESVEIPFTITFRRLDKISHRVKLDFLIRDINGKEWLDNVYLDVYQTPINVNLKTKSSNLKGYFITPEHDVVDIDTNNIKVILPSRPTKEYFFVVVSPKDKNEETAYSLGIDVNTTEFDTFHDTSAFEPNNKEEEATHLHVGDSIKSYLHIGDIDFYTIDFVEGLSFDPPALPFN